MARASTMALMLVTPVFLASACAESNPPSAESASATPAAGSTPTSRPSNVYDVLECTGGALGEGIAEILDPPEYETVELGARDVMKSYNSIKPKRPRPPIESWEIVWQSDRDAGVVYRDPTGTPLFLDEFDRQGNGTWITYISTRCEKLGPSKRG